MEQKRKDCVCAKTWNKTRKGVGDPSSAAALAQHGGPSSAHLHLRLVGFEAAQSSTGCCGLGDPVAAAHSFKLALPHNLHRHPHLPVVGPLGRAAHSTKTWGSEWERRGSAARRGGGGHPPEFGRFWLHLQQLPHRRARHIGGEFLCNEERAKLIPSSPSAPVDAETLLTYEWPHHGIINLPHGFQGHSAVHINGPRQ